MSDSTIPTTGSSVPDIPSADGDPLIEWGWDERWAETIAALDAGEDLAPARVSTEHRGYVEVVGREGSLLGTVSGRLLHEAEDARDLPAVGDWVLHAPPDDDGRVRVDAIAPRRTSVVRRAAGNDPEPQVVAANVDTVFIVSALDRDLSPRRIERYLAVVGASGAAAEVVLTKSDLVADPGELTAMVGAVGAVLDGQPLHVVSNLTGDGLDALAERVTSGATVALVGSSGVGKSTIVNRLRGETLQETGEVRDDGRGRHTTTRRELVSLPSGAVLLDTPGMRELQLWDSASLDDAFPDVVELAAECRFSDCTHESEPGCAVLVAVESGELSVNRYHSYMRLAAELSALEEQQIQRQRRRRR